MGSKQAGTTTSTQNTTPWGPQQPYLEDIFSEAQGLYQGQPPIYYEGSTYAPANYSQYTGLNNIVDTGMYSTTPDAAAALNNSIMGGGYLWGDPANEGYNWFAQNNAGIDNPASPLLSMFAWNNAGTAADADSALQAYARGDYVSQDNPYTDDLVTSITSRVLPGIQSQFIQGGALNSPEAARASTEGVTNAIAPELFARQQQEEQNQMAAANAIAGRQMQGAGLQQQAATNIGNMALQGRGLQTQALGGLSGSYNQGMAQMLQALGLAPQTTANLFTPDQNIFAAGSALQQLDQQQINDAVARWNFQQSLPWDMLNQYIGQVTGNYGGTTTLNQPYFTNPTQNILGTAAGAAGLIGKL